MLALSFLHCTVLKAVLYALTANSLDGAPFVTTPEKSQRLLFFSEQFVGQCLYSTACS